MDYLLTDYKSLEYQNCKYSGHHQDSIKKPMGPPEAYFFSYYLSRSQLGKLISEGTFLSLSTKWVPHDVEVERWLCNPRVSGSIPGAGNLKKLFIWMKIHGLTQKQTVTEL